MDPHGLFEVLLQSGICCTYFIVACQLLQSTLCPGVGLDVLIPGSKSQREREKRHRGFHAWR